MRSEILKMLENNSRIDLHDLAIMMGTDETRVYQEIEKMEQEADAVLAFDSQYKYNFQIHLLLYNQMFSLFQKFH